MEKIWLRSYPKGVPTEIDVSQYKSIADLFDQTVTHYAGQTAYINMGCSLSYGELDRLSTQFGAYLQGALGLPRGTRVALMMPNLLQYPVALFGALRAGYTVVNCNPLYTARELEHQLRDSGAEVVVILENFAHTLQDVVKRFPIRHVVVASMGDLLGFPKGALVNFVVRQVRRLVPAWKLEGAASFREALEVGAGHLLQAVDVQGNDLAFLQYTGGTTGVAKGAMLTHRNIIANLQQAHAWIRPCLSEGGKS